MAGSVEENRVNNWQFAMACVSGIGAFFGASWIIAQSMARNRTATEDFQAAMVKALVDSVKAITEAKKNPEYDKHLETHSRQIETLQSMYASQQSQVAVLTHSHANMKMGFEGFNNKLDDITEKIITLLQSRGK